MEPGYFNVLNDPMVVVSRFEIRDVSTQNNQGSATVRFHRVARTEGHGMERRLVFEDGDGEETLKWSFSEGRFFVQNPLVAHPSLEAVIKEYEESYRGMFSLEGERLSYQFPKDWRADSPAAQRAKKDISDLLILKKLDRRQRP